MKNNDIYNIVLTGLGIALVFISTMFIKIPNAIDGYFNLGDGFILLFSSFLNPFSAFIVGGLGSALADVAGGYAYYFIFTLIIKGFEAIIVSILMKQPTKQKQMISYILGSIIMVFGYFLASWILQGSIAIAVLEIPGNIIQGLMGIIIVIIAYPFVKRTIEKHH